MFPTALEAAVAVEAIPIAEAEVVPLTHHPLSVYGTLIVSAAASMIRLFAASAPAMSTVSVKPAVFACAWIVRTIAVVDAGSE